MAGRKGIRYMFMMAQLAAGGREINLETGARVPMVKTKVQTRSRRQGHLSAWRNLSLFGWKSKREN